MVNWSCSQENVTSQRALWIACYNAPQRKGEWQRQSRALPWDQVSQVLWVILKGWRQGSLKWHCQGPWPQTPHPLPSFHLSSAAPRRRHTWDKCILSLTSSLCFNHRSINDVGGSGMRTMEQVREREFKGRLAGLGRLGKGAHQGRLT